MDEGLFDEILPDKAVRFQNGMIAQATGTGFDGGDAACKEVRMFFASRADTRGKLPDFVRRCSDLGQFWGFIKYEKGSYAERRALIWDGFRPLIEYLEAHDRHQASLLSRRLLRHLMQSMCTPRGRKLWTVVLAILKAPSPPHAP